MRATKRALGTTARALAGVALLVGAACGGGEQSDNKPQLAVRDLGVIVKSTAKFTQSPDFPQRLETTIDAALAYWGGTWRDIAGRSITFEGEVHLECGNDATAIGCFDGNIHVTTRDVGGFTYVCVEETTLVHEIGHAVIGDPKHTDPRWMDFSAVERDLDGRLGYADDGHVTCKIFPSVWRHPPDVH